MFSLDLRCTWNLLRCKEPTDRSSLPSSSPQAIITHTSLSHSLLRSPRRHYCRDAYNVLPPPPALILSPSPFASSSHSPVQLTRFLAHRALAISPNRRDLRVQPPRRCRRRRSPPRCRRFSSAAGTAHREYSYEAHAAETRQLLFDCIRSPSGGDGDGEENELQFAYAAKIQE